RYSLQDEKTGKQERYNSKRDWWLRTSIYGEKDIKIADFDSEKKISLKEYELDVYNSVKEKIVKIKLKLHVQCRIKDNYILLTVTVLNITEPPQRYSKDEYTVFQSKLNISANFGDFINYPKIAQRNLGLTKDE
ncbi:hypothetical protein JQK62_23870, partial [Leptospira santarosai]|nr:hypothetical protein [Leptospira santarosai]